MRGDLMFIATEKIEIIKLYLFGTDLRLVYILGAMMIIDIITGLCKAWYQHNLWSRKSMFGFTRKLLVFIIVIVANITDQVLHLGGGLVAFTLLYYIANEGLSIIENCALLGVPIPEEIKEKLAIMADGKKSFTTEVKEEFTITHNKDLPGGQVDVSVKVEPEEIKNMKEGGL